MTSTGLRCLVLNAGGTKIADKTAAERWAAETAAADGRPDVAFIQEVPSAAWLAQWQAQRYRALLGHPRGWTVQSAILTLLDDDVCVPLGPPDVPELCYHGEYVAAARLPGWASDGGNLTLFSVHASPRPATDEYLRHHPDAHRLAARRGGVGVRDAGKLFDSELSLTPSAATRRPSLPVGTSTRPEDGMKHPDIRATPGALTTSAALTPRAR